MPYPWPSFGSFLFARDETPIWGSDQGWRRSPTYARRRPLGSATDSVLTLAIGSADRSFELYLSPSRLAILEALVNTSALFTDWERPTPDSRTALLSLVEPLEWLAVACTDGTTQKRVRVNVVLVSQ